MNIQIENRQKKFPPNRRQIRSTLQKLLRHLGREDGELSVLLVDDEGIREINRRFLADVSARYPNDYDRLSRLSLIEDGGERQVRMAHLAVVGSFSVNGVAELHSQLLKDRVLRDFYELWPERFNNKTNGISQRRWLLVCNRDLSDLITRRIGPGWRIDLDKLAGLRAHVDDPDFIAAFADGSAHRVMRGEPARLQP